MGEEKKNPASGQAVSYTENFYAKRPRRTTDVGRARLSGWQVPAIKQHFSSLAGLTFIDIGAGDIILGEHQDEIGRPDKFYVQDLSEISLGIGMKRLASKGIDVSNVIPLVSLDFDFTAVPDASVDCAFSNSLFSHLSWNSILLCLRNLRPKMKDGTRYLSSMIVVPTSEESSCYDWSYLGTPGSDVRSFPNKDPYHYSEEAIRHVLGHRSGFRVTAVHDYGHPFQKLVEFATV